MNLQPRCGKIRCVGSNDFYDQTKEKQAMDPNNPVVKLCVAGMQAEGEGHIVRARNLFNQAWETASDDFEACIAAHYLARHQDSPAATLHWNQVALDRAEAVGDERVQSFYPSLYLNMGNAYELLGQQVEARRYYDLAAALVDELPTGRYNDVVRSGITAGQGRVSSNANE
jgi:hypothetical protein